MSSRRGIALPVALVVVLLAALLVTASARWGVEEGKAGAAWSARAALELATVSAVAAVLPEISVQLDSAPSGSRIVITDSSGRAPVAVTATLLPDSLMLLEASARRGPASLRIGYIAPYTIDTAGLRLHPPKGRFRPLPP
jgi:Tfp pilus assembly protein PilX